MKSILALLIALALTFAGIVIVLMIFEQPWRKKK
jgi:hypothetical protein